MLNTWGNSGHSFKGLGKTWETPLHSILLNSALCFVRYGLTWTLEEVPGSSLFISKDINLFFCRFQGDKK